MKQYIYRCNYCNKELENKVYMGYLRYIDDEIPVYMCEKCYKKWEDDEDSEVEGVIKL